MTLANSIIGVGILAMPYCFLKVILLSDNKLWESCVNLSAILNSLLQLVWRSAVGSAAVTKQLNYTAVMFLFAKIIDKDETKNIRATRYVYCITVSLAHWMGAVKLYGPLSLIISHNVLRTGSYIFGSSGKLMIELCSIGFLLGSCITYFVVIGDLGPQILSKLFGFNQTDSLR